MTDRRKVKSICNRLRRVYGIAARPSAADVTQDGFLILVNRGGMSRLVCPDEDATVRVMNSSVTRRSKRALVHKIAGLIPIHEKSIVVDG